MQTHENRRESEAKCSQPASGKKKSAVSRQRRRREAAKRAAATPAISATAIAYEMPDRPLAFAVALTDALGDGVGDGSGLSVKTR